MAEKQRRGANGAESGEQRKGRSTRSATASMKESAGGDGAAMSAPGRRGKESQGRTGRSGTTSREEGTTARRGRAGDRDAALRKELRGFAASHREGWNHDEWNQLLHHLHQSGHDTVSTEEIGRQLERERIAVQLEGVQGVGPARLKKLQEEFGTVWELRHAEPERIASASGVTREVAERIRGSLS